MDASIIRTRSGGPMVSAIERFHCISNILAAIQWSSSEVFWWQLLDSSQNILEFSLCFAKEPIMSSPITFKINVCCSMYVWLVYVCVWIVYVTSVCCTHVAFYLHTSYHWTQWFHVMCMCCMHICMCCVHVLCTVHIFSVCVSANTTSHQLMYKCAVCTCTCVHIPVWSVKEVNVFIVVATQ